MILADEDSAWRAPVVEALSAIGFDAYIFSSTDEYCHLLGDDGTWLAVVDLFMRSTDGLRLAMSLRRAKPDLAMFTITRSVRGSSVVVPAPNGIPSETVGTKWTIEEIGEAIQAGLGGDSKDVRPYRS